MTPREQYEAHGRSVRQRIAEYYGFESFEEYDAARQRARMERARKEMTMANKELMTIKEQLTEVVTRIAAVQGPANGARDTLRGELAGLANPHAQRRLSEIGRQEERDAAFQRAASVRPQIEQALSLAAATMGRREAATGKRQILKRARFVDLPVLEHDGSKPKPEVQESRLRREEDMRARVRLELLDMDGDELAEEIAEATATQNYALLNLATRVVRARAKENPQGLQAAQLALIAAEQAIELPEDEQGIEALFVEIDSMAWQLSDALHEIQTGKEPQASRGATDRVAGLAAEHGPLEGAVKFAEENAAARKAVKDKSGAVAKRIVERAIQADEGDAAAMTNGTNNPAA